MGAPFDLSALIGAANAQPFARVEVAQEWIDTGLAVVVTPSLGWSNVLDGTVAVGTQVLSAGTTDGILHRASASGNAIDVRFRAPTPTRSFTFLVLAKFDAPGSSWMGIAATKRDSSNKTWAMMRQANLSPLLETNTWNGASYSSSSLALPDFGVGGSSIIQNTPGPKLFGIALDSAGTGSNQTIIRQYLNDEEYTSTQTLSTAGNFALDADGSFIRFCGNHDGAYGGASATPWAQDFYLGMYWPNVALDSHLCRLLQQNPWRIYRGAHRVAYSLPAATIPSSLNVAASNITSSGARATVTLAF